MEINLVEFKKSNLNRNRVSFTANPHPYYVSISSATNENYHQDVFGLAILFHNSDSTQTDPIPQYLNTGVYIKYSSIHKEYCITHSRKFLIGHDIVFLDVDDPNYVYLVYEKLKSYSIPYTCAVDTGNDGRVHIIIAFDDYLPYRDFKRKNLTGKLKTIFTHYHKSLIDLKALENPTAFVRLPNAYRINTGNFQTATGRGTGIVVKRANFFKAVDRAYKRKLREGKKVKAKNKGVYKKNKKLGEIDEEKQTRIRAIAKDPRAIFKSSYVPYEELMIKMLEDGKPTYEAIPFVISHVARSGIHSSNQLDVLKRMIAEYSDKGADSRHLRSDYTLEKDLKEFHSKFIKKSLIIPNGRSRTTNDMERMIPVLEQYQEAIYQVARKNDDNVLDIDKIQKLYEYIFCSEVAGNKIFCSRIMTRVCGGTYKRYLDWLENNGFIKLLSNKYIPGKKTKEYKVVGLSEKLDKYSPPEFIVENEQQQNDLESVA